MVAFFRGLVQATPSKQAMRLHQAAIHTGVALIIMRIVATLLATGYHWAALRRLRSNEYPVVPQWPVTITVAGVAVLGLFALWSVFRP